MSEYSLSISFSAESTDQDLLYFEQEKWDQYTGSLTKGALLLYLDNLINHAENDIPIECGIEGDGSFLKIVYSYPAYPELDYTVKKSYGSFVSHTQEDFNFEELITFSFENEAQLEHYPDNTPELTWAGPVYDKDGGVVVPPDISIDGRTVTLSVSVYGSLNAEYAVFRRIHILQVIPREDAIENAGSSVVYGVYDSGIAWIIIDPPPGFDDLSLNDAVCGWGWIGSTVSDDDEDRPPESDGAHREIVIDYCSQETVSDNTY